MKRLFARDRSFGKKSRDSLPQEAAQARPFCSFGGKSQASLELKSWSSYVLHSSQVILTGRGKKLLQPPAGMCPLRKKPTLQPELCKATEAGPSNKPVVKARESMSSYRYELGFLLCFGECSHAFWETDMRIYALVDSNVNIHHGSSDLPPDRTRSPKAEGFMVGSRPLLETFSGYCSGHTTNNCQYYGPMVYTSNIIYLKPTST